MVIFNQRDQFRQYRYKINKLTLVFPDGIFELPKERLMSIVIEENYLQYVYPVISIHVVLEQSTYNKIIENKNNTKIHLDIRKYFILDNNPALQSAHEVLINTQFSLILDDGSNTVNLDVHNKEFPEGDVNEMNAMTSEMELCLFTPNIVQANRSIVNCILRNSNVSDGLGRILRDTGINKNVIMPTVDNDKIYSEFVIPQLKLIDAIDFIASYYGIFRTGMIFYFGMMYNYFLPYCIRSRALLPGEQEIVNIVIPKTGSSITDKLCSVQKFSESSIYLIADMNTFNPRNSDVSGKVLYPEDVDIVENEKGSVSTAGTKNKKTVILKSENPFYRDMHRARLQALETVIEVSVKDCDLSVFSPNKVYRFIFEDISMTHKYQGLFHLVNITFTFTKEETNLRGGAVCVFHKNIG